jgi:hypothetical protein
VLISKVYVKLKTKIIAKNKNKSLALLNEKALNADLRVLTLQDQKLIKKKDVKPIISQPKKSITKFPEHTKKTILITKEFKKSINLSTNGSYLKYEKVYIYTNTAIVTVKKAKLKDTLSIKKSKLIL